MKSAARPRRRRGAEIRLQPSPWGGATRRALLLMGPLLLFVAGAARAQQGGDPARLSVVEAVERALAAHPSVGAARARSEGADAARGETRAARYPTLRVAGSAVQYQEPMLVTPIHGFEPGQTPDFDRTLLQAGPVLSYSLFDLGREARVRQSDAEAAVAGAAEGGAEQALTASVVAGYLSVLGRAQLLEAHDHRLTALRAEHERVRQFQAAGRAAQVEVLRVEAALASAEAERVRIASALDVAERDLARLVGATVEETRAARLLPVALADAAAGERDALLREALRASPALELARRQMTAAEAGRDLARSARWPALDLVGSYINRGSAAGDFRAEWNAGVQVSFPLFTGGAIRSRVARVDATSRAAAEQYRLTTLDVAADLDRSLASLEEARARVASLETAVARSVEVARTEKLALDAGAGVQTDYLAAEAELLGARASLAEARNALVLARVELGRVLGQLGSAWLVQTLEVQP